MLRRLLAYNPEKHHRRSVRLKGYNYSQAGWYYITICTQNRRHFLGEVINGNMLLSEAGKMVLQIWNGISTFYKGVETDFIQIMPNHLHGIIHLVGTGQCVCPESPKKNLILLKHNNGQSLRIAPTYSLPDVVKNFKSITTNYYIKGVKQKNWVPFDKKLWQRNYYEHIIRDENDLNRIRKYIYENPVKWQEDKYCS